MRDEYVGDVGDFGKYILLNKLSEISKGKVKIGINWYYNTRIEKNTGHGDHTQYLFNKNSQQYRNLAPDIFDELKRLVINKKRRVREIEKSNILPQECNCYSEPIYNSLDTGSEKITDRKWWFEKSQRCLMNSNVVFLDPDNGIPYYSKVDEKCKVGVTRTESVKYAYMCEIKKYYDSGRSVIVYNHRDHKPLIEYSKKFIALKESLSIQKFMPILKFKKFQVRHYILIPTQAHSKLFMELHNKLLSKYEFSFGPDKELDNLIA